MYIKLYFFVLQEVVYHGIAFVFYLAASLTLLIEVNHRKSNYYYDYEPYFAASVRSIIIYICLLLINSLQFADNWSGPLWSVLTQHNICSPGIQRTLSDGKVAFTWHFHSVCLKYSLLVFKYHIHIFCLNNNSNQVQKKKKLSTYAF